MPSPRLHLGNVASHLKRAQALRTAPFTYDLPQGRIALHPHRPRHDSKLLVVPRLSANDCSAATGQVSILKFRDLPSLLPPSSLLVRNATRVIPARIPATKASGGRAEILLLHPLSTDVDVDDITGSVVSNADAAPTALSAPATEQSWAAILGGKSIRVGDLLSASVPHADTGTSTSSTPSPDPILHSDVRQDYEEGLTLQACVTRRERQYADVLLSSSPALPLRDVLAKLGLPPLPPYIRRQAQASDRDSFQTTYATHDGSAAAPTAGLHVTATVEQDLAHRQVDVVDVVLHIGTATFRQVEADVTGGHDMHHESISVSGRVVKRLIDQVTQRLPVIALVRLCPSHNCINIGIILIIVNNIDMISTFLRTCFAGFTKTFILPLSPKQSLSVSPTNP